MMCRKSLIFFLVLLLASFSLWAFPGRLTGSQAEAPIDTLDPEVLPEGQRTGSGIQETIISPEPSAYSLAQEKAEQGKRLTASEVEAVLAELEAAQRDYAALRDSSEAKDEALADLAQENARLRDEAGSKAYLMLDGIVGFNESVPEFGAGITVGARIGSDLMLEAGADYMIGGVDGVREFSLDNFQFRLGLGWMF